MNHMNKWEKVVIAYLALNEFMEELDSIGIDIVGNENFEFAYDHLCDAIHERFGKCANDERVMEILEHRHNNACYRDIYKELFKHSKSSDMRR